MKSRIGLVVLVVVAAAACLPITSHSADTRCRSQAAAFRERLEPIVEAVIDGRTSAVAPAVRRARLWWRSHHSAIRDQTDMDRQIAAMEASARSSLVRDAARIAVGIAASSLQWCEPLPTPRIADDLMLVDLAGMTAWLRARGMRIDWPESVGQATDRIAARLVQRRHSTLARRLRAAVDAALATPERTQGSVRPAIRLLDLVDQVETTLR